MKIHSEKISCLIFDYGGTLDTNARHWAHVLWEGYLHTMENEIFTTPLSRVTNEQFREAYVYGERALAKAPIVKPDDNFRIVLEKKVTQEIICLCEKGYWQGTDEDCARACQSIATYCYEYAARTVAQSREILKELNQRYRMVLVSNFYGNIQAILKDFHLDFFEEIIESAVVGVRKPDPAIYRLGVEAAGCPAEECVVIGDSFDKDIVPANTVGCKTVWLKGEGWTADKEEDPTLADAVIFRLDELRELL